MDLTPYPDDTAPPPDDVPSQAVVVVAGAWTAALWSDRDEHPAAPRCVVDGPGGRGDAWVRSEPTTGVLQLVGLPARVGPHAVTLRRNRPRLRRR